MQPVFRFAPSPNGELHLGHAFSALFDHELCRRAGGRFLVRIEDIDRTRCRPEYEVGIFRELAWLGLEWEEPVRRQSEHFADYAAALDKLAAMGLVYPAFLSRGEIAAMTQGTGLAARPGRRAALSRRRPRSRPGRGGTANRERRALCAPPAHRRGGGEGRAACRGARRAVDRTGETGTIPADPTVWGDFILARKETPTSYHLSVVVDDAAEGVTHVVRGRDLFHATAAHVLLQRLLGLPSPDYHHHALVTDTDGRKLSKSDRDTSLRSLREAGATPDDIRRIVGIDAALAAIA